MNQKKPDRTNVLRDPYRKLIEGFHVAGVWLRIVTQRPSPFFKFFERSRPGTFIGRCGGAHGTISVLNLSTMLPLTSFCSQDRQPPNDRIKFSVRIQTDPLPFAEIPVGSTRFPRARLSWNDLVLTHFEPTRILFRCHSLRDRKAARS